MFYAKWGFIVDTEEKVAKAIIEEQIGLDHLGRGSGFRA